MIDGIDGWDIGVDRDLDFVLILVCVTESDMFRGIE